MSRKLKNSHLGNDLKTSFEMWRNVMKHGLLPTNTVYPGLVPYVYEILAISVVDSLQPNAILV